MECQRDVVTFEAGKPVAVALLYGQGKPVKGAHGERVMFSLVDQRVMFLDPEPARQIVALGVKAREPFFVAMYKRAGGVEWNAWLAPEAEKGRALEDAKAAGDGWTERKLTGSIAQGRTVAAVIGALPALGQATAKETGREACPTRSSRLPLQSGALSLLALTRQMIDVYAAAVQYAEQEHGGRVKRDEVLSIMLAGMGKGKKAAADV